MKLSKQFQQYESEFTQFLNGLKKNDPELEQRQRQGRALLWEKTPIDLDWTERSKASKVKQAAYVYQTK